MSPNDQAEPKPTVTKNSSEFNRDAYASIPPGELVVFAVQVLQADGAPAATEDIVSICFRFFPHSFALKNYFYWPDSALVTRRLHDAKEKGLLKGNAADGFETKVQGRQIAKHAAKALRVSLPVPPKVETPAALPVIEVAAEKNPSSPLRAGEEEKKDVVSSTPVVKAVKKRETLRLRSGQARRKEVQKKAKGEKQKAAKHGEKPAEKKQASKWKVQAKRKKDVFKAAAPVKKKPVSTPKAQPKPAPKKTIKPAKAKVKQKPGKVVPKPKTRTKPVAKARVVKTKIEKAKLPSVKRKGAKAQGKQPAQLTMPLTLPAAWKKAGVPAIKPKPKEEAPPIGDKKPVRKAAAAPVVVSKEEKNKAAKVVKQIERSDAYQLYRRNGRRANIGEFDFRNMLFATMESSAETLNRNVDLFKRYAGIQYRSDLAAFLEFCEGYFAALLKSKAKKSFRR